MPEIRPLALVNARLLDPVAGTLSQGGVIAVDGCIADLGGSVTREAVSEDCLVVDCEGDVVAPGVIDMRAFVGEPGQEHRETFASMSAAAAAGGVTTIVSMSNTDPAVDDPAIVDFLLRRARAEGRVRFLPAAAITKKLAGREISEIGLLREAGAVAFSDGTHSIANASVMRRAMTYAKDFDSLIMHLPHDRDLAGSGVATEGEFAMRLGLPAMPIEAETVMLDRDLRLAALTKSRYHAEIVSSSLSIDAMARAKDAGLLVTCGVGVHHLTLNESDIGQFRTFLKFAPPLRSEEQRSSLVDALASGLIDVVVSDHTPQDVEMKRLPFAEAAAGAIGVETLVAAAFRLVHANRISLPKLWRALSSRPAEILGLPQGRMQRGAPADLVRLNLDEPWVVEPAKLHSRCRNTAFDHAKMSGRVRLAAVAGEIVYD